MDLLLQVPHDAIDKEVAWFGLDEGLSTVITGSTEESCRVASTGMPKAGRRHSINSSVISLGNKT